VGKEIKKAVSLEGKAQQVSISWTPPAADFTGYFVDVRLTDDDGKELDRSQTAVDVSSEWNRFPRYGYLAQYSVSAGARPEEWIAELNKFHIDGLEYYDFQNRHEHPLAGTVERPDSRWEDIAGREIEGDILDGFLRAAHQRNMMSMAYNSSYSAYEQAFTDGSPVKLEWATWDTPDGPRSFATTKALVLPDIRKWKTHRLIYMNQNGADWQHYIFGQMADLFRVYPFDGWHIDSFGTHDAYAYDGSRVDFIAGFQPFVDKAKAALHKRITINTVDTLGQDNIARSQADFVYSELWDDHETYSSICTAADEVHAINPGAGLVFSAYIHRREGGYQTPIKRIYFNPPSVLLADATIFASGASHIELGDGFRMLSSEYFPADSTVPVSEELRAELRHYYDFLTAYENILRDRVTSSPARAEVLDHTSSPYGIPDTVWTIAREKSGSTIVHLINLLGSEDPHWRDKQADRPDAPLLKNVNVRIYPGRKVSSLSWATPDTDGGRLHALSFKTGTEGGERYVDATIPSLKYWDLLLLQ
jgi:dextranase